MLLGQTISSAPLVQPAARAVHTEKRLTSAMRFQRRPTMHTAYQSPGVELLAVRGE
jgi:hypothetical protein